MAKSLICSPFNHHGLWPAARTPGPLGWLDQADPNVCALLGDTPGPLGICDAGDPTLFGLDIGRHPFGGGAWRTPDGTLLALATATKPADVAGPPKVTATALKTLFNQADDALVDQVVAELNTDLVAYGLGTALRQAHFLAQIRQEVGAALVGQTENLNYQPAALKAFTYYKNNPDDADTDGFTPGVKVDPADRRKRHETIANRIYGGRTDLGNGDEASGDGWRFRGRGMKQLTGRYNYARITKRYRQVYTGSDLDFEKTPDLVADYPYNLRTAVCFWLDYKLPALADAGSERAHVDAVTAVVNKNTPSYGARWTHFQAIWPVLK